MPTHSSYSLFKAGNNTVGTKIVFHSAELFEEELSQVYKRAGCEADFNETYVNIAPLSDLTTRSWRCLDNS